jgi:hypothetical protein
MTLKAGDIVVVRPPDEILATLDERGELEGLPFMPEMIKACGQRFVVSATADRVCDRVVVGPPRSLWFPRAVVLDDFRCDGTGHDGCQAECRVLWKEAWLCPVADVAGDWSGPNESSDALRGWLAPHTREIADGETRFRCQATLALNAAVPLSVKDARSYVRVLRGRNVSVARFVRVMVRAVRLETAKKLGRLQEPEVRGRGSVSPRLPVVGLQPGDRVRVKTREQIEATLNDKGRNRGLFFDREELAFCGKTLQVRQVIKRFIDERTGKMVELKSDCVSLEGGICSGEDSIGRWFCPRGIYAYWREGWLEPVSPDADHGRV